MLLEILIILVTAIIFLIYPLLASDNDEKKLVDKEKYLLSQLNLKARAVINHIQLKKAFVQDKAFLVPRYNLFATKSVCRNEINNANEYNIYIVLRKEGKFYDGNTLIFATLHEIAHIIVPDGFRGHPEFEETEKLLLLTAFQLGYYDPNHSIDPKYPHSK
jgi:hypothetical protein